MDGRCYIISGGKILEICFTEAGNKVLPSAHQVGNVLEQGTKVFDGVVVQNLFDAHWCSVFPSSKCARQFALRELDGYEVVDAKYERGILQIVGVERRTGRYDRFVFWSDDQWVTHAHAAVKDVTFTGLNFTVLDNGVCVQVNEDDDVEVFRTAAKKKVISDPVIDGSMRLASSGAQALFTKGGKLCSITMAQK